MRWASLASDRTPLCAGTSFEEVLADYPFLKRDDILAAVTYAAQLTDHVVLKTARSETVGQAPPY